MGKYFYFIYIFLGGVFLFYLALPSPKFPLAPSDSMQSAESGDSEELNVRRAYFTDFTREEVMSHYLEAFNNNQIVNLRFISYRLNYPPEEAFSRVRDQTRSTFLEEIVHPFRENIYVNGFEPIYAKDEIWYGGRRFRQKITVKVVRSNIIVREIIGIGVIAGIYVIYKFLIWQTKLIFR